jgi:hypothetical protein
MMARKLLLRRVIVWIAGSAVGAVVIALPDSDDRVFSLSRSHGPSPLDLRGIAILIGTWLPVAFLLPSLWRAASRFSARFATALAIFGAVGVVITIGSDTGWVWLVAAAALIAAQIILIVDGWRGAGEQAPTQQ